MRFEAGKKYKTINFASSELRIIAEIRKWLSSRRDIYGKKLIDNIPYMFWFVYDNDGEAFNWEGGRSMGLGDSPFRNTFTLSMVPGDKTILCNFDSD